MSHRRRPRVVSLVPSSTETLLALGADVVACTRFCEQPGLPNVGGTKNPDVDAIIELAPDVVVLDREENRRKDHDELVDAGLHVVATDVRSVIDAVEAVATLADLSGTPRPAVEIPPPAAAASTTVFVPIWRRPWMTIGPDTYGASVLRSVGADVVPVTGDDYPTVELVDVAVARPALVLVPSEPYDFSETHLGELRAALPEAAVRRIDGQDLFWWGIRTPAAIRRLRTALGRRPPA